MDTSLLKLLRKSLFPICLLFAFIIAFANFVGLSTISKYSEDLKFFTLAHLQLVFISMLFALIIGLAAGILLSRSAAKKIANFVMQIFNVGNTLPSIAVLAIAMTFLGIGILPAVLALFLASLLPIVRNTYSGLISVNPAFKESARAMGMTTWQSLIRVEIPNAMPVIIAGVRTALSINIGTAPLAFLIGADSLGSLIFPGVYLYQIDKLIIGTAATALMAIVFDFIIAGLSSMWLNSRGLSK